MRQVLREGIDRRYVLLPVLAVISLVITAFLVAEARRDYTRSLSEDIRLRQERMRDVAELVYAAIDSESAQRGYLLTGETQYIEPYDESSRRAATLVDELIERYSVEEPAEVAALQGVKTRLEVKLDETEETIGLMRAGRPREALATIKTDMGLRYMREVRDELEALRARERDRVYDTLVDWNRGLRVNTIINASTTAFTVLLVVLVGFLATREIRRRQMVTSELERQVEQRTEDLRELSAHLLRIGEREKSALARELHDELGGLLVAMRMDFAQLRRRHAAADPDSAARWQRIDGALTAGVELKRRVIEELRPTLLDNMGLVVAVRWQAEQTCAQGRLKLEADLPEEEPELPSDAAIAIFRCAQEALANVLKHARASCVRVSLESDEQHLRLVIEDDGVGLPEDAAVRTGSHGLKQMRFRMQAVGGSFKLEPASPHGVRCTLELPL
jgi:signal transduction histidine kinase